MKTESPTLETPREVIMALGGISAVAKLTRRRPGTVSAWQTRLGYLPPHTYAVLMEALSQCGKKAPQHLWKITEAKASCPPSVP
jgi:hypothetical protein